MQRRLVFSYLLLVSVTLALFAVPVTVNLTALLRENETGIALREARSVALLLGRIIGSADLDPAEAEASTAVLAQLRTALEAETGGRVELIDAAGRPALGRAVHDPGSPALAAALRGEDTVRTVDSSVLGQRAVEVTVPARSDTGVVDGAVRLSYPTAALDAQIRSVWYFRSLVALGVLAAAVALGVLLARSLTRPLRRLDVMARSLSAGDFSARVDDDGPGPRETRRLARTLNDGARQLGALITAQQQFVADASHQLRTPLTALRLNLDNLYDTQTTDDGRRYAERAINEVQRMISLVNDLLILARAQAGTRRPEVLDLADMVGQRVEMWEAAAADTDVRLSVEIAAPHAVVFDPSQLDQVLDNVLSNALRVAPPHSVIKLSAYRDREDDSVFLYVADRGPGMTAEQKHQAFERFWRGHSGGTGLGLTIVQQFVEDNGGHVELFDRPGGGLVVRLRLRAGTSVPARVDAR